MNELTSILEKISTLNINANTNIDIQQIVQQYVLFDTIKNVSTAFITFLGLTIIAILAFVLISRGINATKKNQELKKMDEVLENFGSWKKVEDIQEQLKEIIDYMPRNKRKR